MTAVRLAPVLAGLLAQLSVAYADTIVLKDGQRFEGAVEVEGDQVHLVLDMGVITFSADDVKTIDTSTSVMHEFDRLFQAVPTGNVRALQRLATWAKARGLSTRAQSLHALVIAVSPDNAVSRRALGHYQKDGRWIDPADEAQAALRRDYRQRADQLRAAEAAQQKRDDDRAALEALIAGTARSARTDEPAPDSTGWAWGTPFQWVFTTPFPGRGVRARRALRGQRNLVGFRRGANRTADSPRRRGSRGRIRSAPAARRSGSRSVGAGRPASRQGGYGR